MDLSQLLKEVEASFNGRQYHIDPSGKTGWTLIHAAFELCEPLDDQEAGQLDKVLAKKQELSDNSRASLGREAPIQHKLAMRIVDYLRRTRPELMAKEIERVRKL